MKHVVVFTGAGVSAESGIKTFRDSGGLWEEYRIEEVATPEAWSKDPHKVLHFYNLRRKQVLDAKPNPAHFAIAELENYFKVTVITQNIDDLHERAGSSNVLHLHGEILKSRSTKDPSRIYTIPGPELNYGDHCELGSQKRPHIVWFGEMVPAMEQAEVIASDADIFIIIGTSMNVYPAAGLIHSAPADAEKYFIDPDPSSGSLVPSLTVIRDNAGSGVPRLVHKLVKLYAEDI